MAMKMGLLKIYSLLKMGDFPLAMVVYRSVYPLKCPATRTKLQKLTTRLALEKSLRVSFIKMA